MEIFFPSQERSQVDKCFLISCESNFKQFNFVCIFLHFTRCFYQKSCSGYHPQNNWIQRYSSSNCSSSDKPNRGEIESKIWLFESLDGFFVTPPKFVVIFVSSIGNGGSSAEIFSQNFAPDFFSLIFSQNFAPDFFSLIFSQNFAPDFFSLIFSQNFAPDFPQNFALDYSINFLSKFLARIFSQNFQPKFSARIFALFFFAKILKLNIFHRLERNESKKYFYYM